MQDLVSVIIVTYNNGSDLELCIQSAVHQSYPHLEVIVIDNGSTDGTTEMVRSKFAQKVAYIRQKNVGEAGGRNEGLRHAKGAFIQFIDGDDFIAPDKIEKQMLLFNESSDFDILYGDLREFQSNAGPAHYTEWAITDYQDMLATQINTDGAGLTPNSVLIRRKVFDKVGNFDENLPARCDQDYWIRSAWAGFRFRYSPGAIAFYRRRPDQITADDVLFRRGKEIIREKALQYIDREPYRSFLTARLAELRFLIALSDPSFSNDQARKKLALAHETDKSAVPLMAYSMGIVATYLPARRKVLKSPNLRWFFRKIAFGSGLRVNW